MGGLFRRIICMPVGAIIFTGIASWRIEEALLFEKRSKNFYAAAAD
jgi:hypothetical protein